MGGVTNLGVGVGLQNNTASGMSRNMFCLCPPLATFWLNKQEIKSAQAVEPIGPRGPRPRHFSAPLGHQHLWPSHFSPKFNDWPLTLSYSERVCSQLIGDTRRNQTSDHQQYFAHFFWPSRIIVVSFYSVPAHMEYNIIATSQEADHSSPIELQQFEHISQRVAKITRVCLWNALWIWGAAFQPFSLCSWGRHRCFNPGVMM